MRIIQVGELLSVAYLVNTPLPSSFAASIGRKTN